MAGGIMSEDPDYSGEPLSAEGVRRTLDRIDPTRVRRLLHRRQ